MGWEGLAILGVTAAAVVVVATTRIGPDLGLMAAVVSLLALGALEPAQALSGFANEVTITIAALFVVAGGIRETGLIGLLADLMLGRPRSILATQLRIMAPVALASGFVNNTPLVSVLLPAIDEWARKFGISASRLLIPLSYASILGGMCTLIGTSTNLLVNGLLGSQRSELRLGMFDPAWVGVPCALAGIAYLLLVGRRLLPDRQSVLGNLQDAREYSVEMVVSMGSGLAGKTIEAAGLRHLAGLYLMEIDRGEQIIPAVSSEERLQEGDRLVFVGIVDSIVELQKVRGLTPATGQVFKLDAPRSQRTLVEAVVSDSCPLVGASIREGRFRLVYNAAVIAVGRNGTRLRQKIGDIILRPGDMLLMEANPTFVSQQRNSRDFYLVSQIADSGSRRHDKSWLAGGILVGMIFAVSSGLLSLLKASLLAAGLMLVTRCCTKSAARASINLQVLVVVAAALGLGQGLLSSGAAGAIAGYLVDLASNDPTVTLLLLYGLTMLVTELMTNNAAAVLVFPLVMAAADLLGVSPLPLVVAVMVAASASFLTPIGYHTNLMVFGPGGYRFGDYVRIGLPLSLIIWLMTALLAPVVWPFTVG